MKILAINVSDLPSGNSSDLINANVFQDYDAIVVAPDTFEHLYGRLVDYRKRDERIVESKSGHLIHAVNENRQKEVFGLLAKGGAIICFMESPNYLYHYDESNRTDSTLTNYDWMPIPDVTGLDLKGVTYSMGKTIDNVDTRSPFYEYLSLKPTWSAYIDISKCQSCRVIASAFKTHALALVKEVEAGYIVLLPSEYNYQNGEILERCIAKLLGEKEVNPPPEWAKSIFVPGQNEITSEIKRVSEHLDTLTKQKEELTANLERLERWKWLLYAKGKHQLEPVVREAFTMLGCHVKPQPDKDSDGIAECKYGTALLEVVGSTETIRIEKLGELSTNMGDFMSKTGQAVGGIIIGNPFCDEPLNNRPPKGSQKISFSRELAEKANRQGISILLSTDLYAVVARILKDEITEAEKQSLLERIFNGRGLVRLVEK